MTSSQAVQTDISSCAVGSTSSGNTSIILGVQMRMHLDVYGECSVAGMRGNIGLECHIHAGVIALEV